MDAATLHLIHVAMGILPFAIFFFAGVMIVPYWVIFKKAGFTPWLAFLMVVPLVNLVVLYVVAFSDWQRMPDVYAAPASYTPLGPRS
jgi:hypothetical protein